MSVIFRDLPLTGIGSMPKISETELTEIMLGLDIPFFPTFPFSYPEEQMLAEIRGPLTLPPHYAERGENFLKTFPADRFPMVKAQLAGPLTVFLEEISHSESSATSQLAWIEKMAENLMQRALTILEFFQTRGREVLFFIDEPSLHRLDMRDRNHRAAFKELHLMIETLREQKTIVGLHCCAEPNFDLMLGITSDVLSFDAVTYLGVTNDIGELIVDYFHKGGSFSLGVIPTDMPPAWNIEDHAAELLKQWWTLPFSGEEEHCMTLRRCLLTPVCGLGWRSAEQAREVFAALQRFRQVLVENHFLKR